MRDPGNELAPRFEVSSPELTPDQLDLLEDSLEWMGDPARRGELDAMPAPVRERADVYASILELAREAMPEQDLSPGLLDAVLAEARQAGPTPAVSAQGPSLWDRLRRSFVLPGVALAGTAALLLVLVRPSGDPGPELEREAAPAPAAPEPPPAAESRAAVEPEPEDMAEESDVSKDRQEATAEAAAAAPPADLKASEARPARAGGGVPAKSMKKEALPPEPLPGLDVPDEKRADVDKDDVRDKLESGDRARSQGRCDLAEAAYLAVARSNGPAAERARALAGLGLCRQSAGNEADASRYFNEARAADASVEQWLRGQGEPTTKKQSKTSSKSKADRP